MRKQQNLFGALQLYQYSLVFTVGCTWAWFLFLFTESSYTFNVDSNSLYYGLEKSLAISYVLILVGTNSLISALLLWFDLFLPSMIINIFVTALHLTIDYKSIIRAGLYQCEDLFPASFEFMTRVIFIFVTLLTIVCFVGYVIVPTESEQAVIDEKKKK